MRIGHVVLPGGGDRSVLWALVLSAGLHQVMPIGAIVLSVEKPWGRLRTGAGRPARDRRPARPLTRNQKVA